METKLKGTRLAIFSLAIFLASTLAIAQGGSRNSSRNRAPIISGTPPGWVIAGDPYDFLPVASDPDGDALTFTVRNRPAWATFDSMNGRLQGTPRLTDVGTYSDIVISVRDWRRTRSLPAFSIIVTAPATNTAPTISGTPPMSVRQGAPYAFQPLAADTDGDPLTFTIANRPAWATFNNITGVLQGTPGAGTVGSYNGIVIAVNDGKASKSLPAFSITVTGANSAPIISGTPPTAATVGTQYAFTPTASDADGDLLTFSIVNKPAWASFTPSTGRLQGTPTATNVGTTSGITITVTDGLASRSLTAFNISVQSGPTGSAVLSWVPPTHNADGSPLINLAGYRVYWGTSPGSYPNSVSINNPAATSYVVGSLVSGTYYFAVTAFNTIGAESQLSNSVSKTIP